MSRYSSGQPHTISISSTPVPLDESAVMMSDVALIELDIDRVCRLLLASERTLALLNRRALAATLANVPPSPGEVLPPAPPFAEAVAIAREDGQLIERTRLFLATHPRAIEELTPELTRTLVRIFDPTGRTARLIRSRSPLLSFFVSGAAIIGALTLLVSATLLISHVITDIHHPVAHHKATHSVAFNAAHSRLTRTAQRPVLAVDRVVAHPAALSVRATSAPISTAPTQLDPIAPTVVPDVAAVPSIVHDLQASPHSVTATTPSTASQDNRTSALASGHQGTPVRPTARATAQGGNRGRVVSASDAQNAHRPAQAQITGAPAKHDDHPMKSKSASSDAQSIFKTAGAPNGITVNPAQTSGATVVNTKPESIFAGTAGHDQAAKASSTLPASTLPASASKPVVASPVVDRQDAARQFAMDHISAVAGNQVQWVHVTQTAPSLYSARSLVTNGGTSTVVDYTLQDTDHGFTVVNSQNGPH